MSGALTVEERLQVEDLLSAYVLALDVDDTETMLGLFTDDGEIRVFGRTFRGRDGLRKMLDASPKGLHVTGRSLIRATTSGAAVRSQLVFFPADRSEHRLAIYDDEIVRTDDGWRFQVRDIRFLDSEGVLSSRP